MNWNDTRARLIECGVAADKLPAEWAARVDLNWAKLSGADLSEADLREAKLRGADLSGAKLREAKLREANLSWADLSWADLRRADLRRADLSWVKLNGADLSWADLSWAKLNGADLSGADLSGADLREANLSGCTSLLDPAEWLARLESDDAGVIVYKCIGHTDYAPPAHWSIEPGAVLTEVANPNRTDICGCGVNIGTREWCDGHYPDAMLWRCRIRWIDLAGVVVPYNSDGKARCGRLELIEKVTR